MRHHRFPFSFQVIFIIVIFLCFITLTNSMDFQKNNHIIPKITIVNKKKERKVKFMKFFENIFYKNKKKQIIPIMPPKSQITIWKKISSGILSIIFEFLKTPEEFINFTLFLKKYIPQMKTKFRTLPQKLTKEFLDHRCYHFPGTSHFLYSNDDPILITEYFLPMNSLTQFISSVSVSEDANMQFQIFQMFIVEFNQKNLFTLILYQNNTLEYFENSFSTVLKKQFYWISQEVKNFPKNWNQDIFSMDVKNDSSIKIINKNLNVQIYIKYFEKEKIVNFFAFKLGPDKNYFKIKHML